MRKPLISKSEMIQLIAEIDAAPYRKAIDVYIRYSNQHNMKIQNLRMMVRNLKIRNKIKKGVAEKKIRKNVSHLYSWIQELKTEKL